MASQLTPKGHAVPNAQEQNHEGNLMSGNDERTELEALKDRVHSLEDLVWQLSLYLKQYTDNSTIELNRKSGTVFAQSTYLPERQQRILDAVVKK